MSWSLPTVVIFQPPDGFEVPPVTTAPPVGTQPPASAQPPAAVQPPVGAQPPPVAETPPAVAQAVTVAPPVTTQDPARLQPVLVTGQALGENVIVQVDRGPPIHAEPTAARDPSLGGFGFSATVVIPDSPGPHLITATALDTNSLNPTANVQVWVGPAFAIAPPALLAELYWPYPMPAKLVGEIQQHLTSLQTLAGNYGLTVAGPAFTLDTPPNSAPVVRIGLWITDSAFATVPASLPDLPLPSLSEAQAASCFGTTALVLTDGSLPHATIAVSLPTTTLQTLADAALPKIAGIGARHNITVNTLTASTSPPDTVTMTADCTFTLDQGGTIGVTETLGTQTVFLEEEEPAYPTPVHVPVVTKTAPVSSTDLLDDILDIVGTLFSPLSLFFASVFVLNNATAIVGAGDAATEASGIIGPLLSSLPYAYPFPNTLLPSTFPNIPDFPVLSLDWTSFGATNAGVVGGISWSLENRFQDDVVLTIQRVIYDGDTLTTSAAEDYQWHAEFTWALQNLNPDSFTWTLSGAAQGHDNIVGAGPFTQSGTFTVPISIPNAPAGLYQFTLSVSASETCASDPAQVPPLTAAWSSPIWLNLTYQPARH
jgi:hypothetical protein